MSAVKRFASKEDVQKLSVLPELVTHHLAERGDCPAVSDWDNAAKDWRTLTYRELYEESMKWARAFTRSGLKKGDRVAMLLPNSIAAIVFDQGALLAGLVPVPLHIIDTPANCAYILGNSEAKALVTLNRARWHAIETGAEEGELKELKNVILIEDEGEEHDSISVQNAAEWLKKDEDKEVTLEGAAPDDLACLVYTSGTTGKPKGVMLTHRNIMSDVQALLENVCPRGDDVWLSFLPLSHMFERTTSYYIGLGMGSHVYFSRGLTHLANELKLVRPTIFMSVPRVYEKVYAKIQERLKSKGSLSQAIFNFAAASGYRQYRKANGLPAEAGNAPCFIDPLLSPLFDKLVRKTIQEQFGGRLRVAVSGGAALNYNIAKMYIGLGIHIHQGYGMTETSPILSVNKIGANDPATVGQLLPGIEARLGNMDELQVRGPQIMKGYWKRPEDTAKVLSDDGWLSTGDQADILPGNFIRIKGRIKEIIVTSTGEKIAPVDVEQAVESDPLFAQSMVHGEDRPFVTAVVVLNPEEWKKFANELGLDAKNPDSLTTKAVKNAVIRRIKRAAKGLPQYGVPRSVHLTLEPWTIENNMLTPTLKLKRRNILAKYSAEIDQLYKDFGK